MERNENNTKKKWKTAIIFASKQNEAKRKRKTAIIFASKRNEAKRRLNFFALMRKKCFFGLFLHLKRNENEMKWKKTKKKQKLQSEKG